jgi:hypothetical protein
VSTKASNGAHGVAGDTPTRRQRRLAVLRSSLVVTGGLLIACAVLTGLLGLGEPGFGRGKMLLGLASPFSSPAC